MKKNVLLLLLSLGGFIVAAQTPGRPAMKMGESDVATEPEKKPAVKQQVKAWRMLDEFTFADTLAVDTLIQSYQIFNPIYKKSISAVHLGNLGSPSISMDLSERDTRYDFLFFNALLPYFDEPESYTFYNTRTPYVNLTYHMGQPKRRAEEMIRALFTQNINKKWNVGIQYKLFSSVGRYEAQKVDNQSFRLFSSYSGERYEAYGFFSYARSEQFENGGITNEDFVLNAPDYDYNQPENIPVNFLNAKSRLSNYQFFYHHGLKLGEIEVKDNDDVVRKVPVATVYHTLHVDQAKRRYRIDELPEFTTDPTEQFYQNIYIDSLRTIDSVRYGLIHNKFQIQFNEEANPWLRFGLRAFVGNEIQTYQMPAPPVFTEDGEVIYQKQKERRVSSYLGGRVFKNQGDAFRWNAGIKFYFQGYRAGDLDLNGRLDSYFNLLGAKTNVYVTGLFRLRTPQFFEEQYFSNHFQWNQSLNREKRIEIKGGLRLPENRASVTGFLYTLTDYVYFGANGMPQQHSGAIQIIGVKGQKHFQLLNMHTIPAVLWQYSSNRSVLDLPDLSLFASTYYQNRLFKVLTFQIGFDVRYNTRYYTPYYVPAIGQFVVQNYRKVGNYPFADLFLNLHLKRARAYIKYEHANKGWPNNDYFHTIFYPANPRSIKFGVSWNFYD